MAKLLITGKMDKKMLVYPLLRVLSIEGDLLFITDDISFNRLFNGTQSGKYRNITLYVGDNLPTGGKELEIYKNILVVSEKSDLDNFHNYDAVLIVHGPDNSFYGQDINELIEDLRVGNGSDNIKVVLQSIYPVKTAGNMMVRKAEHFFYVSKVEEMKELLPCKDSYVEKILTNAFADSLNIKPKQFASLLRLNPYNISKKVIGKGLV